MDSFVNDVCAAKTDADEKQALQALNRWSPEQALFIPMWFRPEIFYVSWVSLEIPESLIDQSDIDHWSIKDDAQIILDADAKNRLLDAFNVVDCSLINFSLIRMAPVKPTDFWAGKVLV